MTNDIIDIIDREFNAQDNDAGYADELAAYAEDLEELS